MDIYELTSEVESLRIKLNGLDGSIQFIRIFIENSMAKELEEIRSLCKDINNTHKTITTLSNNLLESKKYVRKFDDIKKYNQLLTDVLIKETRITKERIAKEKEYALKQKEHLKNMNRKKPIKDKKTENAKNEKEK